MRFDDPRRIGHPLTLGRKRAPAPPRIVSYVTVGRCACDRSGARFVSERAPSDGGFIEVRVAHEAHVVEVEGELPALTRAQLDALLSYSGLIGRLMAGRAATLDALARGGLAWNPDGGCWVPTDAGMRVIDLYRRSPAA